MKNKQKIIIGSVIGTFVLVALILVANFSENSFVKAEEFAVKDNIIEYKDNDMTVDFKDKSNNDLGTIELKSHSSVTEVKGFGWGKEQVVMYYDFTNWDYTKDGLGEVTFIDMKTKKEVKKDYEFVEWKEVDVPNYVNSCSNKNGTEICSSVQDGTRVVGEWIKYESNDIPEGDSRIGLRTYVEQNDYMDGVWTIVGQIIDKHITWEGDLQVILAGSYSFDGDFNDNTSGNFDGTGVNLNAGAWKSGADCKVGGCLMLLTSTDYAYFGTGYPADGYDAWNAYGNDFSINFWMKRHSLGGDAGVIMKGDQGGSHNGQWALAGSDTTFYLRLDDAGHAASVADITRQNEWDMVTLTYNQSQIVYSRNNVYVNSWDYSGDNAAEDSPIVLGVYYNGGQNANYSIDQFDYFNETISEGIRDFLWNDGDGRAFGDDTLPTTFDINGTLKYSNGTGVGDGTVIATYQNNNTVAFTTTADTGGSWGFQSVGNATYIITGYNPNNASIDGDVEAHVVV